MQFTKMHGCGNDYIYINGFQNNVVDPSQLAIQMSNRNFGVGSDGLVLILPSDKADFRMRMFNSDGSESEMCGNAIRCIGKYVYDKKMTDRLTVTIDTMAGVKELKLTQSGGYVQQVQVDMGEPILNPDLIPVMSSNSPVMGEMITLQDHSYTFTCVSMGNPHAITFVDSVETFPVELIGSQVEKLPLFPNKTNVEFVEVVDTSTLKMRVWERGTGETLACGTGACASLVAAVLNNRSNRKATLKLLGGSLLIEWNEATNHIFMTGPAATVFEGDWLL